MEGKSSTPPTFLDAPLRRVLRRVADDAPIDATIDLVSSFATGEEVSLLRGIKAERNKLQSVLQLLRRLLVDAEHKAYQHAVGSWLGDLRDAIWDAEDLLDEYATDAAVLHQEWRHKHSSSSGHHHPATHGLMCQSEVWNYFSEKLKAYPFDKVRGRLEDIAVNGELDLGLQVGVPPPRLTDGGFSPVPPLPESDPRQLDDIVATYDHLSPQLKECFAYCSLFPQGYKFEKDELVQLWMAQGFLDSFASSSSSSSSSGSDVGLPMEYWGKRHLEELLSLSLLERTREGEEEQDAGEGVLYMAGHLDEYLDGGVDLSTYVMSDVTRGFAVTVSQDYCVIPADTGDGEELEAAGGKTNNNIPAADSVRHLSRVGEYYYPKSLLDGVTSSYEKLRSLLIHGPDYAGHFESMDPGLLEEVVFTKLRRLRVLGLRRCLILELPPSIGNLRHLRLLDLSVVPIRELPESVGDLYNLQALLLSGCFLLKGIPQGLFCKLKSLRHLDLSFCDDIMELPESLGDLCDLRVLKVAYSGSLKKLPESLANLTNLVELHAAGTCIERVPEGVGNLANLRILRLPATFEELPESLGDLRNLQVLSLSGGGMLKKLPQSFCNLTNLTDVNLSKSGLEMLPQCLYNLPKLRQLNLTGTETSLEEPADEDAIRRLVNEKGVVFWYYGKHTHIPASGIRLPGDA